MMSWFEGAMTLSIMTLSLVALIIMKLDRVRQKGTNGIANLESHKQQD
jgi:hypothetical protein